MKRIITILLALVPSLFCCHAQIKAPIQFDTIVIKSMQYNLMDINEENWTFDKIIRTPSCFIISDTEYKIHETSNMGRLKEFSLNDPDGKHIDLKYEEDGDKVIINFSGYKLVCTNPHYSSVTSPKPRRVKGITASYILDGRKVAGSILVPFYSGHLAGTIVVKISVDRYGQVTKAVPGAKGTTFKDDELWESVIDCAKQTHFNMDGDAPLLQTGTISYVFNGQ